jgi:hypothetical protein
MNPSQQHLALVAQAREKPGRSSEGDEGRPA